MQSISVTSAYAQCLKEAQQHYENFPTATRLVAKQHQDATAAIYSFARHADDIADENPAFTDEQRLADLTRMNQALKGECPPSEDTAHIFIALSDTIKTYGLPILPFEKLITAFSMDITKHRFRDFKELLFYCEHSANPVGELILRLHRQYNTETAELSDKICTALQLINFMQDIDEDFSQRDRIYIPQDEMAQFNIKDSDFSYKKSSATLESLVSFQLHRACNMLASGAALTTLLSGRLKLVIKLTVLSGLRVCEKLHMRNNVFVRPTLNKLDWLIILARLLYFRYYVAHAAKLNQSEVLIDNL